jgi:metal-sulfur cluster biosynthetic enzyme
MSAPLQDAVRVALREVIDPELGRNLVDLGLIYAIEIGAGGAVAITMTTTTRGCPLADFLRQAVETRVGTLDGVASVEARLTWEPAWTPAMALPE